MGTGSKGYVEYDTVTKNVHWIGPDDLRLTADEMVKAIDEAMAGEPGISCRVKVGVRKPTVIKRFEEG